MTKRTITDAELDVALRALVVEDESVRLEQRVLAAIEAAGTDRRGVVREPVPAGVREPMAAPVPVVSWLPRAACAGGAVLALVLAIAATLYRDVPLPAAPVAPPLVIANGPNPLADPDVPTLASAPDVERVAYRRPAARVDERPPLIDPLAPPSPLEIERLHTPPLEQDRLRIQALTVEPLSVPPLAGD